MTIKYKKLITILAFSIIMLFILFGCEPAQLNTHTSGSFTEVERGGLSQSDGHYVILYHNETGVYYLATSFTDSGGYRLNGLTVMLNTDGTPYTGK